MPAAFECWNDQQYAQIDSQYPNLRLVQKGSVYCDQQPADMLLTGLPSEYSYYRDITIDADTPTVSFRCTDFCHSAGMGYSGNTFRHRFWTRGKQWVDYWLFADKPVSVGHGIEVFNQSGQLVYTSKDKPAKVYGNWNAPTLPVWGQSQVNFGGVRQLAVIANAATWGIASYPFGGRRYTDIWGFGVRVTGAGDLTVYYRRIYVSTAREYGGNSLFPANNNYTLLDSAGQ